MTKLGQWFRTRWRQNRWKDLKHMFWVRGRLEQKDIGSNRIFWFCSECLISLKCPYKDDTTGGWDSKESAYNAGDMGLIPELGRSLEKEMATHSSILAWRILWPEEPGRLPSLGSHRVGHNWSDLAHMRAYPPNVFNFDTWLNVIGLERTSEII